MIFLATYSSRSHTHTHSLSLSLSLSLCIYPALSSSFIYLSLPLSLSFSSPLLVYVPVKHNLTFSSPSFSPSLSPLSSLTPLPSPPSLSLTLKNCFWLVRYWTTHMKETNITLLARSTWMHQFDMLTLLFTFPLIKHRNWNCVVGLGACREAWWKRASMIIYKSIVMIYF